MGEILVPGVVVWLVGVKVPSGVPAETGLPVGVIPTLGVVVAETEVTVPDGDRAGAGVNVGEEMAETGLLLSAYTKEHIPTKPHNVRLIQKLKINRPKFPSQKYPHPA